MASDAQSTEQEPAVQHNELSISRQEGMELFAQQCQAAQKAVDLLGVESTVWKSNRRFVDCTEQFVFDLQHPSEVLATTITVPGAFMSGAFMLTITVNGVRMFEGYLPPGTWPVFMPPVVGGKERIVAEANGWGAVLTTWSIPVVRDVPPVIQQAPNKKLFPVVQKTTHKDIYSLNKMYELPFSGGPVSGLKFTFDFWSNIQRVRVFLEPHLAMGTFAARANCERILLAEFETCDECCVDFPVPKRCVNTLFVEFIETDDSSESSGEEDNNELGEKKESVEIEASQINMLVLSQPDQLCCFAYSA
jgi:hypothetical protein